MAKKPPRRTAERILEVTLDRFNRFGEPHVSTTMLAAELGISPGNLYYHYPAKDELILALLDRHEEALAGLYAGAARVEDADDAWRFVHRLADAIWSGRFLYRDPNELLTRNRRLEQRLQQLLLDREAALDALVAALHRAGELRLAPEDARPLATNLSALLAGWVAYAGVRAPREAMEPAAAEATAGEGARQALRVLLPHLQPGAQSDWRARMGCPVAQTPATAEAAH
jgi:AcrR family transcriptional regulator